MEEKQLEFIINNKTSIHTVLFKSSKKCECCEMNYEVTLEIAWELDPCLRCWLISPTQAVPTVAPSSAALSRRCERDQSHLTKKRILPLCCTSHKVVLTLKNSSDLGHFRRLIFGCIFKGRTVPTPSHFMSRWLPGVVIESIDVWNAKDWFLKKRLENDL